MNRSLWELQEIDNVILRLKRERSRLDDGTNARGERDTLQLAFDAERTKLTGINTDRTDRELQLKSNEEKMARQQSRLMSASSGHEIVALERDIKAINAQRGDFDEAILILMDEAETSSTRLSQIADELKAANAHLQETEANFARETMRLESELETVRIGRDKAAAVLAPDEIAKYDASAKAHANVAVARIESGHCSVCGMTLPTVLVREAKTQTWPTCDSCGRLLFVE